MLASAALDPERILWVPGQRKLFLPPTRTLVQAKTLQEALSKGLTAIFPDGARMQISLSGPSAYAKAHGFVPWQGLTVAEMVQNEILGIEKMGGRVIHVADLQAGWPQSGADYSEWDDADRFIRSDAGEVRLS